MLINWKSKEENVMFDSIFQSDTLIASTIFIVLAVSLLCGALFAFLSCYKSKSSVGFMIATGLLPMTVALVIALVNGNLGVGVAIAGAFGLVRFRSAPGTAKEITIIFIAMAAGLAFGTGYLAYGSIFLVLAGMILFICDMLQSKARYKKGKEKIIRITIPEDLNYEEVFTEVFQQYTSYFELERVKTTNMGSMFRLTYHVRLKNAEEEKKMIDALRVKNGNLEIISNRADLDEKEL